MGDQSGSNVSSQREELQNHLETVEERVDVLENTLKAIARETRGISISGPCKKCGRCLLILDERTMYCPKCGNGKHV